MKDVVGKGLPNERFRVDYDEFKQLIKDNIVRMRKFKRKVLINELKAKSIGTKKVIDECMKYTIENKVEVVFKYNTKTNIIFDSVYIGTADGCNSFITQKQMMKEIYIGEFHTHPNKHYNMFGYDDFSQFFEYPYSSEMKLGLPFTNEIITIVREDIHAQKNEAIASALEENLNKASKILQDNFKEYVWVLPNGRIEYTAKGKKFERKTEYIFRKIATPILKIEVWKDG